MYQQYRDQNYRSLGKTLVLLLFEEICELQVGTAHVGSRY